MKEEWRAIPGYVGLYEASNLGRIKALSRYCLLGRNHSTIHHIKEKILNVCLSSGYYHLTLYKDGVKKTALVHRIIAETFIPNPDNLPQINHKNENKLDNNVENLEWCDSKHNINYGKASQKRKELIGSIGRKKQEANKLYLP